MIFGNNLYRDIKDWIKKLEIVQSERVTSPTSPRLRGTRCGRAEGYLGGISPALQILGEICSNYFERTPPKINIFKLIEVRVKFYRMVRKFNRKIFLTLMVIKVIIYKADKKDRGEVPKWS